MTQKIEWNLYLLQQLVESEDEARIEEIRNSLEEMEVEDFDITLQNARINVSREKSLSGKGDHLYNSYL